MMRLLMMRLTEGGVAGALRFMTAFWSNVTPRPPTLFLKP